MVARGFGGGRRTSKKAYLVIRLVIMQFEDVVFISKCAVWKGAMGCEEI